MICPLQLPSRHQAGIIAQLPQHCKRSDNTRTKERHPSGQNASSPSIQAWWANCLASTGSSMQLHVATHKMDCLESIAFRTGKLQPQTGKAYQVHSYSNVIHQLAGALKRTAPSTEDTHTDMPSMMLEHLLHVSGYHNQSMYS